MLGSASSLVAKRDFQYLQIVHLHLKRRTWGLQSVHLMLEGTPAEGSGVEWPHDGIAVLAALRCAHHLLRQV
jgi:hypothetical protein